MLSNTLSENISKAILRQFHEEQKFMHHDACSYLLPMMRQEGENDGLR